MIAGTSVPACILILSLSQKGKNCVSKVGTIASCKEPILKSETTPTISAVHPFIPIQNLFPNAASGDPNPISCINFSFTTHLAYCWPSGKDSETALVSDKLKNLPAFNFNPYSKQNFSSVMMVVTGF